ncbi:MAG: outer membrane lipoprotein chaperone LolA [bacterium]|nr:MAG: outer membrane lipoprotein chaperone LolA [bacterium]
MKSKFQLLIFAMIILIYQQSILLFAVDNKASEIIKKVKDKYDEFTTFNAEFIQTFHWKLADNVHEQKGKIWLKGNEKFRIETEDQTIVSDGKTIWTYSQFNNQVIIDNLDKSNEDVRLPKDIFFKYSEQYRPVYLQDDKIDNQDCHVLELRAKTEDVFIKYMKIWINTKILVPIKIEQVDLNNNTNTYILKNIQINKSMGNNFFVYKVPDSVEIIDMR